MKNKLFFLVFSMSINIFAQNFKLDGIYYSPFGAFSIKQMELVSDDEIIFYSDLFSEERSQIKMNYTLSNIDGVSCIKLNNKLPYELLSDKYKSLYNQSFIKLSRNLIFLCAETKKETEILVDGTERNIRYFIGYFQGYPNYFNNDFANEKKELEVKIQASSFLREENIIYDEKNLSLDNPLVPWCEGVSGDGIGEYVIITDKAPYERKFDFLMIMNGYFSVEKPYLYKQNGRVKRIKVTGLKSRNKKILDVLDTPHPQTVDISFLEMQEPFRVTIVDVYKGTKYDDTCINCMEPWDFELIPYESHIAE